jgi:hypothetical protein
VALAAEERDIERRYRGATIFSRKDVVVTVAVDAPRGEGISAGSSFAVE